MADHGWGPFHNFHPELRNEGFALISFMGFPAILSALQPFQICIFNREYSKLIFSNGSQLMGKRFMANLHASSDSTCKSRVSKMSTRCQIWGVQSTPFDPELRNEFKNFSNPGGSIPQNGPIHKIWYFSNFAVHHHMSFLTKDQLACR